MPRGIKRGSCGGTPKRDGSGRGIGNRGSRGTGGRKTIKKGGK